jgi:hypothetical protein
MFRAVASFVTSGLELWQGEECVQSCGRYHSTLCVCCLIFRAVTGFVTSGLELWQGEECAQSYFRQRLWGTLSMAQTLLADRGCWMRHMKLDPVTGDLEHICSSSCVIV